jgi:hypothetical protein
VACGDAAHAIIGGEKDVNCRLFGAREMESIVGAKSHRLQFLRTCDSSIRQRDCAVCVPVPVVKTGRTPQIAPSDRWREAETVQLHPAGPLCTPL